MEGFNENQELFNCVFHIGILTWWVTCCQGIVTKINLGYYISEELAAEAYDKACIKYHGEFGRHNSTKDEKVVFEEYPILPRCKRTFSHITYEVVGDDGSYFGTIKECADYFKVKTNTVVKWVSDARTVRGVKYKYGKKLNIKKFI